MRLLKKKSPTLQATNRRVLTPSKKFCSRKKLEKLIKEYPANKTSTKITTGKRSTNNVIDVRAKTLSLLSDGMNL
jgi:hypothetical protein